jgi:heme A synthase
VSDHDSPSETRIRYPLRAILAVAGAWLLFLIQVLFGAFTVMMAVPLVPIFFGILMGGACLLSSAHQYALSLAREEPRPSKLRAPDHGKAQKAELAARPA